jgi:hypothetical protein
VYVSASKLLAILDAVGRSNVSSSAWLLNINLSDEKATGVGCEILPLILLLQQLVSNLL